LILTKMQAVFCLQDFSSTCSGIVSKPHRELFAFPGKALFVFHSKKKK